jgi:hypothetical protein
MISIMLSSGLLSAACLNYYNTVLQCSHEVAQYDEHSFGKHELTMLHITAQNCVLWINIISTVINKACHLCSTVTARASSAPTSSAC